MPEFSEWWGDIATAANLFQFLRPWWLLAAVPALLVAIALHRSRAHAADWSRVISPQLLPWLLDGDNAHPNTRKLPLIALVLWLLAAFALSGPSWKDIPVPVQKNEQALVILLDLSPSMLAEDLKPSRLVRARLKLLDLLKTRDEGVSALIAYAGDAHTVTPLTDDTRTITALVPALTPNIMPISGNAPEAAVEKALELLANAGYQNGDIFMISDGLPESAAIAISRQLKASNATTLSVLGVGTAEGAPIPEQAGGFYKDRSGTIVIARYDDKELRQLANRHRGIYVGLDNGESDIKRLQSFFSARRDNTQMRELERTFDIREDKGYWFALLLLPFAILAFRRNLLALIILLPLLSSPPTASALEWSELWLRADQRGSKTLEQGDPAAAQQQFTHPDWQASAAYRNGDYETAARLFEKNSGADGHYNRGNSLAQTGDYDEAIAAYDQALKLNPQLEDAAHNRKLLETLKRQQEQKQDQNASDSESSDSQDPDSQNPNSQNSGNRHSENSDKDSQNTAPQSGQHSQDKPEESAENSSEQNPNSESQADNGSDINNSNTNKPDNTDESKDTTGKEPAENNEANLSGTQSEQGNASETEQNTSENGTATGLSDSRSEEQKQAHEQWLRSLPDDPGSLMRRKFLYEAQTRPPQTPTPTGDQRW